MSYRSRYLSTSSGLSSNRSYGGAYRSSLSSASSFRSRYETAPTQESTSTPSYHSSLPRNKYYSREETSSSNDTSLKPSYSSLTWRGRTTAARRTADLQEGQPGSGNDRVDSLPSRPGYNNGSNIYCTEDLNNGNYRSADKPRSRYLPTQYPSKDDRNTTQNRYNSNSLSRAHKTLDNTIGSDKNPNPKRNITTEKESLNRNHIHSYVNDKNGIPRENVKQMSHSRLGNNSESNGRKTDDRTNAMLSSEQNYISSSRANTFRKEENGHKPGNSSYPSVKSGLSSESANTSEKQFRKNSPNSICFRQSPENNSNNKAVENNLTDSSSGCELSSDDESSSLDSDGVSPECDPKKGDESSKDYEVCSSGLLPSAKCPDILPPKRPTSLDFQAKRTYIPVTERKIEQVINGANEQEKNSLFKMAYSTAMVESRSSDLQQKHSPRRSEKSPINNLENILVTAPRPYHSPSRNKSTYPIRISPSPSRNNSTSLRQTTPGHTSKISKSSDSQLPPHPIFKDKNRSKVSDQQSSTLTNKLSSRYKELATPRRRTISQSSGTNSGGRNSRSSSISRGSSPDHTKIPAIQRGSSFEENGRRQIVRPNIHRPRSRQNSGLSSDSNSTNTSLRQTSRSNSSSGIDKVKKQASSIPSLECAKRLKNKSTSKNPPNSNNMHSSRSLSAASSMASIASSSECHSSKSSKTRASKPTAHNFWEEILHSKLSPKEHSNGSSVGSKCENETLSNEQRVLPGKDRKIIELNKSRAPQKTDSSENSRGNDLFEAPKAGECKHFPNYNGGSNETHENVLDKQSYENIEPYVKPTMYFPENDEETSTNIDLKNSDTAGQIGSLSDFSLLSSAESFDHIPYMFDNASHTVTECAIQKNSSITRETPNTSKSTSLQDIGDKEASLLCDSFSNQNGYSFKEPFSMIDYDAPDNNQRDSGYLTEDRLHSHEFTSPRHLSNDQVSNDNMNSSAGEGESKEDRNITASRNNNDHNILRSSSNSASSTTQSRGSSRRSPRAESLEKRRSIFTRSAEHLGRYRTDDNKTSIRENIDASSIHMSNMSESASSDNSTSQSIDDHNSSQSSNDHNSSRSSNDHNSSRSRNDHSSIQSSNDQNKQSRDEVSGLQDESRESDNNRTCRNSAERSEVATTASDQVVTDNDPQEITDDKDVAKQHLSHFISSLTNIDEVIGALKNQEVDDLNSPGNTTESCASSEPSSTKPSVADEPEERWKPPEAPESIVNRDVATGDTERPASRNDNVQQKCSALIENLEICENEALHDVLYSMKKVFQECKQMVPEFTGRAGLESLMKVANRSDSKAKNYILRALGQLMLYVDGMRAVVASTITVQWLYSLLDEECSDGGVVSFPAGEGRGVVSSTAEGVSDTTQNDQCRYMLVKTALRLMLVFVEYTVENALRLIEAIHAVDTLKGFTPWFSLVSILGEGDPLDIQLAQYSIKLINRCLFAIDDLDHFYDQTDCMDRLGMETTIVRYIGRPDADRPLSEQLQLYEAVLRHEDGESTHGLALPADANFRRSRRLDSLWNSPDARVSRSCRRRDTSSNDGVPSYTASSGLQYRPACDAWSVSERRKVFAASDGSTAAQPVVASAQIGSGSCAAERTAVTALENSISESGMTPALRRRRENQDKAETVCDVVPAKTVIDEGTAQKEVGQQPTVRDLCEKLARQTHVTTPVSPETETATATRLDQLTGIVSKAKEGLTRSTRRSPEAAASDPIQTPVVTTTTVVAVQPEKKSDVDLRWEQLVSDLKRPLVLADLDFTDLTDTDESEQVTTGNERVDGNSTISAPAPPPLPALFQNIPPPLPPPLPPIAPSQTTSARLSVCSEDGSGPLDDSSVTSSSSKQRKTIKLFWKTVRADLLPAKNCTVWDELPEVNLDTSKLEILFESKAKDASIKKQGENKQMKELSVLGHKRSNAINIGMTKLPPPRVIKAAILKMDSTVINKDGIEKLLMLLPSDEEMSAITEAQTTNPDLPLGSAETLLLTLGSISEITARLRLWLFRLDYENVEKEVAEPLMDLKQGLENLMANKTFRRILGMLRGIGNFLNNSQAKGFNFDYLAKVPEVKDTLQKHSLLHHLCRMVTEQFPSSSDLYSEIGAVTRASRVDFQEIGATIRRMESECKASWDHLKLISKHDGPSPIRQKMSDFLSDSAERIIVLGIVYRRVMNRFTRFLTWLGLSAYQMHDARPTAVCRVLSEFALEYRTTRERVLLQLTKTITSTRQNRPPEARQQNCQNGCSDQSLVNQSYDRTSNHKYSVTSPRCRSHRKPSVEEKADAELRRLLGRGNTEADGAVSQSQSRSLRRRMIQPGAPQTSECPSAPGEPNGELLSSLMKTADRHAAITRAPRRYRRSPNALTHRKLSIKRSRTRDTNVCVEE